MDCFPYFQISNLYTYLCIFQPNSIFTFNVVACDLGTSTALQAAWKPLVGKLSLQFNNSETFFREDKLGDSFVGQCRGKKDLDLTSGSC